jgi:hypothetical protein
MNSKESTQERTEGGKTPSKIIPRDYFEDLEKSKIEKEEFVFVERRYCTACNIE